MYSFPELIKRIRTEAGLTQSDFARIINVSPILIAMVESGQKEVSKTLIQKIAVALEVSPASISPFLYGSEIKSAEELSAVERKMLSYGIKLQDQLITKQSKLLKDKHGKQTKE